jgi:3-hydroxybutyryl-CoA dehydratase
MIGTTIEQIKLGDKAEYPKTISESDVYLYAGVTGDFNTAHMNDNVCSENFFQNQD